MEQKVTMAKVRDAIKHLQNNKERVSRRNVLAITGGGMSSVHRLMSQIEDADALAALSTEEISDTLIAALRTEIGHHVQQDTENLQEQMCLVQGREREAIEALESTETFAEKLNTKVANLTKQLDQQRQSAEKNQAISSDTITRLETTLVEQHIEQKQLIASLESSRVETAKARLQNKQAGQEKIKAEAIAELLTDELTKMRQELSEAKKRAAVSKQKALDLREALTKAENRASLLEDRM